MFKLNYSLAAKAYKDFSSFNAIYMLHIIHARQLEPLSAQLVEQIAKALIYCGDYFPEDINHYEDPILPKLMKFIHLVLERTTRPSITTVDDAIRHACETQSSIPVICPATTIITALYYLSRFRKKFGTFTHSAHVTQRLFLVAYLVAAKHIFVNLKSLVSNDTLCQHLNSCAKKDYPPPTPQQQQQQQQRLYIPTIQTATLPTSPSSPPTVPSSSQVNDRHFDIRTSITKEATHFLEQVGDVFTIAEQQPVNATQLCSMEMEFLHFLDYQLEFNPLHLWSWFYTTLDDYCQLYHTTVGIGSNHVGSANSSNSKAATAS